MPGSQECMMYQTFEKLIFFPLVMGPATLMLWPCVELIDRNTMSVRLTLQESHVTDRGTVSI